MAKNVAANITGCRSTRIYCRPDCPAGKRTKPENKINFISVEEARSNGYRPCKICKPEEEPETLFISSYDSPLGEYVAVSSASSLVCLEPLAQANNRLEKWQKNGAVIREANGNNSKVIGQLDGYFAGELQEFDLPLDLRGTPFQKRVWASLQQIPYGETCSYGEIARAINSPSAVRAVGLANGANPVSIIVPCHRVIGSDGRLVGYGGGLDRKKYLLEFESRHKQAKR
ncbi:MAG: methylated-DNA--[protein]-cysteine S-methyltransferase [Chloroflexi bacterium]|nr:methylated-DNA--[protein]-cysteine S-methyltransferase [Chloroflexota bacterium]